MDLTLFKTIPLPNPRLTIAKPLNLSPAISTSEATSPKRPLKLRLTKKLISPLSQKQLTVMSPTTQEPLYFEHSNSISTPFQSPTSNPYQDKDFNKYQVNVKDIRKQSLIQKDARDGILSARHMIDAVFEVKSPQKLKRCFSESVFFKGEATESKPEPTKPITFLKLRSEKDVIQTSRIAKQENQKLQKDKDKKEALQFHLNLTKALDKTEEKQLVDSRLDFIVRLIY